MSLLQEKQCVRLMTKPLISCLIVKSHKNLILISQLKAELKLFYIAHCTRKKLEIGGSDHFFANVTVLYNYGIIFYINHFLLFIFYHSVWLGFELFGP